MSSNAERASAERKCAHRRTFRISVVDIAITPGKDRVSVGKIGQIAAPIVISPRIFPAIGAARGVFPFRFGRQTVFPPFARAEPLAKFNRVQTADVNDRMTVARAGGAFARMAGSNCSYCALVMGCRDM